MEAIVFDFGSSHRYSGRTFRPCFLSLQILGTCGIQCGLAGQDVVPREFITWAAVERAAIDEPFRTSPTTRSPFPTDDTASTESYWEEVSRVCDIHSLGIRLINVQMQLLRAIRYCYRECLLMEPSQRKVLICDGPLMTMARKRDLADCFLRELKVHYVYWMYIGASDPTN